MFQHTYVGINLEVLNYMYKVIVMNIRYGKNDAYILRL